MKDERSERYGKTMVKPPVGMPACHSPVIGWRVQFPLTFKDVKY